MAFPLTYWRAYTKQNRVAGLDEIFDVGKSPTESVAFEGFTKTNRDNEKFSGLLAVQRPAFGFVSESDGFFVMRCLLRQQKLPPQGKQTLTFAVQRDGNAISNDVQQLDTRFGDSNRLANSGFLKRLIVRDFVSGDVWPDESDAYVEWPDRPELRTYLELSKGDIVVPVIVNDFNKLSTPDVTFEFQKLPQTDENEND